MDELNLLRAFLSLAFVLGLITLLAYGIRRFDLVKRMLPKGQHGARLEVEEMLMLDTRHRLMLIRRDDVRHLIVLGPETILHVEADIPPPPTPTAQAA